MEDKTSFLSRWAQRKAEQQNIDETDPQNAERHLETSTSEATTGVTTDTTTEEQEAAVLTDEDMPDVETLNESSDFSQFFSAGVSDELRDIALQKLFRLPEFNLRDGLNDYDEDFSKMPELAEAVASKLRNWVEEQKDAFEEQLKDENSEDQPPAHSEEQPEAFSAENEPDEDELGEADLDG